MWRPAATPLGIETGEAPLDSSTPSTKARASARFMSGGYSAERAVSDSPNSSSPCATFACDEQRHTACEKRRLSAGTMLADPRSVVHFWKSPANWHWASVTDIAPVVSFKERKHLRSQIAGRSQCLAHLATPYLLDAGFSTAQGTPALSAARQTSEANRARALCRARYPLHSGGVGVMPSGSYHERSCGSSATQKEEQGGARNTAS